MIKYCPCGSKKKYDSCCKPYHDQNKIPSNPKTLLYSRYSAYAKGLYSYIVNTTYQASNKDPLTWSEEIRNFSNSHQFLGVKIYEINEKENIATIKFKAILKKGDQDSSFIETSVFIKEHGKWYYQNHL